MLAFGCGEGGGFQGASSGSAGAAQGGAAGAGGLGAGSGGAAGTSGAGAGAGSGGDGLGGLGGAAGSGGGESAGMAGLSGSAPSGGEAGSGGAAGLGGGGAGGAGSGGAGGAGSGGTSGSAGSGAASGSSGAAGNGGNAGTGATAGTSGSNATGGTGGTAGAGVSGSGGTAGSGGPLKSCEERCNIDADCRIFSLDQGYRCNTVAHRCERFAEPCRTSLECIPSASVWVFECRTDMDCFFFTDDLCVDVGGFGRCARVAPSANGCADPNPDEITLPRFGSSGTALVCANASRTCADGACVAGCTTNSDCTPVRNGSVCDTANRLCRCVRNEDCGGPGVSHCNTETGRCECASARDCEEVPNTNACLDGRCGCSGVSACSAERTFSGTTYVCE